jgi:GntR family transcriptional regulator
MTAADAPEMPVYLRLRSALASAILEGEYREGDQLPSVRAFAAEHSANPLTVAKAYQSLQDDNYVSVRRGVGMFVADGAIARLRDDERNRFLTQVWPRIRAQMNRLGIEPASLLTGERV